MKRTIAWFAEHGVAANVLMLSIVIAGLMTAFTMSREIMPETTPATIIVRVPYPGAAPEEVEQGVILRIEEALQPIEGIEEIRSVAAEDAGTVRVKLTRGADPQRVLNDVKSRVDSIASFPELAERPVIEQLVIRREVLTIALSGEASERTLKRLAEQVREDLLDLPGITQVELAAARPYEISIEVSQRALRRYGLSFSQVAQAIRDSSLRLPGGTLQTRGGEVIVRVEEQAYLGAEFERLALITRSDGSRVTVGDVASVVDGFADTDQSARFDGRPAVLVRVFRVGDQDAIAISNAAQDYIGRAAAGLPEGIALTIWLDSSRVLKDRLALLQKNGIFGFILVFIVLALFLRLQLAGWVALGIPISFLGAAILMPPLGVTINLISLFAFIVVLGIVVDDAIVVGENIYSRYQSGEEGLQAAVNGATQIAVPVVFAVATTMAAFVPLLFVPGIIGDFMRAIPVIVIATLAFSLAESLLVLPHHLSRLRHSGDARAESSGIRLRWRGFRERFGAALQRFVEQRYAPSVRWAIEWRYFTLALGVAVLMVAVAFAMGGWVRFTFFPPVEADQVSASLAMPRGTPAKVTEAAVRRIEQAALELGEDLRRESGERVIRHVLASIGEQPLRSAGGGPGGAGVAASGGHLGEVALELAPSEQREITSQQIADRWRERVGALPDVEELTFTGTIFRAGAPIDIQLAGQDMQVLRKIAESLKAKLRDYPGVFDIADSYRAGKEQLELDITPEAQAAGLTLRELARQVRGAFYGEEAQRIQRGREEIKVMVRLPERERRSEKDLEDLRIRGQDGLSVPLSVAAHVRRSRSPSTIERVDRARVLNVTADLDPERANANRIVSDMTSGVLPELLREHPRVRYTLAGEQEEQRETLGGLARGFVYALIGIYVLLAIPFRSYVQPILIMAVIPFGLIGAVIGHLLLGLNFTILSMFGLVALAGVVINDGLVLIDFVNRRRQGGVPLERAVCEGGSARFRPIVLTSLTTFAGLAPLLLEQSLQAQFLIPMAASLAFGVIFATAITLYLLPAGYMILEDARLTTERLHAAARPGRNR